LDSRKSAYEHIPGNKQVSKSVTLQMANDLCVAAYVTLIATIHRNVPKPKMQERRDQRVVYLML
jgi:hypothetical protein